MQHPTYSLFSNIRFMLQTAWKFQKSVLFLCLATASLTIASNVMQLFLAPALIAKIESVSSPLSVLSTLIAFISALLFLNALLAYLDQNTGFGRINVRIYIFSLINRKACETSFPNTLDPEVLNLQEKARQACAGNNQATETIWNTLTQLLINLGGLLIYILLLSSFNAFLLCAVLLTSIAGFVVSNRIHRWGYSHRQEESSYYKKLDYLQYQTDSRTLAKDIRIFGMASWLRQVYQSVLQAYEAFVNRRERIYFWTCVVDAFLSLARNGIAYLYLINLTLNQGLSVSEFLLFFSAFTGFSTWITGILTESGAVYKQGLDIACIQEFLYRPELFRFCNGRPIPQTTSYELKLENVTFSYPQSNCSQSEKPLLKNFSLTLHPGEKLAIVGLNGAGKTTLVKLLCGFYDPDQGRVLLNGIDIREFNRQEYYRLFSAVFQDFSVLDTTLAEAVAQSATSIDLNRVRKCLKQVELLDFIEALPKGLQTPLGKNVFYDGITLSGGQLQRLMMARALYKNGPFLILDEPTAALDPLAENDIYLKYNAMTHGKSSIFISHRLASTRFCDRILFLQNGCIAEEGTHETLLQRGGAYAQLFEIQARYYQEGGNETYETL